VALVRAWGPQRVEAIVSELARARAFVAAAAGPVDARARVLAFLDAHADALLRSCLEGHLTASVAIVDATEARVLLLRHRKLGLWLQPGGHADGDGDLAAVAAREAREETGLVGEVETPAIDVDVHAIPERPGEPQHLHLDVRFRLRVAAGSVAVGNHESTGLRWVSLGELDDADLNLDESTKRLVRAALER
jgi:8-oxo-dGTP pyrophosphatase MutT (NUDIX family)